MSAWAEIVNSNGSDEWLELCAKALTEVQAETSRRNARVIRASKDETRGATQATKVMEYAAGLIDPEVSCQPSCSCACHTADTSPCDDCSGVSNGE